MKNEKAHGPAAADAASAVTYRRVPLADLHPDPGNARAHNERNMAAIRDSLVRFQQAEPLVVQKSTGRVIGGNGRLAAMRELGWTECDIAEVDVDDREARALSLALNRTAELAEWDLPTLSKLLQELRADDDLYGVGFEPVDIDKLLEDLGEDLQPGLVDDQGPVEPPEQPTSRRGDLWLLDHHALLCGDSTNQQDIERLLAGTRAQLLASDPPYCVGYDGSSRPQDSGKDWSDKYKEVEIEDLGEFLRAVFRAVLPNIDDDAAIYIWHAHLQYPTIDRVFEEFGLLRHQPIIWKKPSSTFTYSFYRWAHEPCLFGWKQGHKPPHYLDNGMSSVWEADWDGKARFATFHPTSKPTLLFEIPMQQHTRPGAVVLEPFCGSGSQLIAAEKLGRRCRAMEIAPPFVDGAVLRWQTATGKEATLDGDGRTFAEVRNARAKEDRP